MRVDAYVDCHDTPIFYVTAVPVVLAESKGRQQLSRGSRPALEVAPSTRDRDCCRVEPHRSLRSTLPDSAAFSEHCSPDRNERSARLSRRPAADPPSSDGAIYDLPATIRERTDFTRRAATPSSINRRHRIIDEGDGNLVFDSRRIRSSTPTMHVWLPMEHFVGSRSPPLVRYRGAQFDSSLHPFAGRNGRCRNYFSCFSATTGARFWPLRSIGDH